MRAQPRAAQRELHGERERKDKEEKRRPARFHPRAGAEYGARQRRQLDAEAAEGALELRDYDGGHDAEREERDGGDERGIGQRGDYFSAQLFASFEERGYLRKARVERAGFFTGADERGDDCAKAFWVLSEGRGERRARDYAHVYVRYDGFEAAASFLFR